MQMPYYEKHPPRRVRQTRPRGYGGEQPPLSLHGDDGRSRIVATDGVSSHALRRPIRFLGVVFPQQLQLSCVSIIRQDSIGVHDEPPDWGAARKGYDHNQGHDRASEFNERGHTRN